LNRPRILLADDHPHFVEAEAAFLKPVFDVLGIVPDGAVLIVEVLRLDPDIVVTDISMPRVSGIEAAHKLRELRCRAKFVFLTVHTDEEFVSACVQEGALGYVHKSLMKAHLIPAIEAALAGQTYLSLPEPHKS
jgi:DNA-binding NarL/FixJ family response regulator